MQFLAFFFLFIPIVIRLFIFVVENAMFGIAHNESFKRATIIASKKFINVISMALTKFTLSFAFKAINCNEHNHALLIK